jgi:hypothetical protein
MGKTCRKHRAKDEVLEAFGETKLLEAALPLFAAGITRSQYHDTSMPVSVLRP